MEEIDSLFGSEMINHWISQLVAMGLTIFIIPRLHVTSFFGAISILIAIALLNAFVWDAALFFSIPNTLTTSSIALLVINGILFWIMVKMLPGIEVEGILPAIVAPVVFSIVSVLLNAYGAKINWILLGTTVYNFLIDLRESFKTAST